MDYTFTTSPEGLILSRIADDGSTAGHRHHGWDKRRHEGWSHAPHWGVLAWLFGNTDPDDSHKSIKEQAAVRDDDRGHKDRRADDRHGRDRDHGKDHDKDDGSQGLATQYTYDNALRLIAAQGDSTESYAYDAAGNITQFDSGSSTTFAVNNLNQIVSADSTGYVYDANGNLLDDGVNTYTWDGADRLVQITNKQSGHTSQFAYDGFSRRVSDTETDSGASPVVTRLLWCGETPCEKRDGSDAVLARYYGQGELQSGQALYYAQDQVGSVVAVVDSTGKVIGRLSYDSYGNITSSSGTLPDFRYAGLYYHQASGLHLATYRAYDAKIGRWTSRDPIRESGGINLYTYVLGNPINLVDVFGLRWQFVQGTGQWNYVNDQTGAVTPVGQGYSGTGPGRDNPDMQDVPNVGPIPQGTYDVGQGHYSSTTGPMTMNLTPINGTNTYGRDLFRIHGDNASHDASHGCPIAPPNVRQQINNSNDHVLEVVR